MLFFLESRVVTQATPPQDIDIVWAGGTGRKPSLSHRHDSSRENQTVFWRFREHSPTSGPRSRIRVDVRVVSTFQASLHLCAHDQTSYYSLLSRNPIPIHHPLLYIRTVLMVPQEGAATPSLPIVQAQPTLREVSYPELSAAPYKSHLEVSNPSTIPHKSEECDNLRRTPRRCESDTG